MPCARWPSRAPRRTACLNTLARIPPAKRFVVFEAFNQLCTLAQDKTQAKTGAFVRYPKTSEFAGLLGRFLKNLDAITALHKQGRLTQANLIRTCFPDMKNAKSYDLKTLTAFLDDIDDELGKTELEGGEYADIAGPVQQLMNSSGCSLKEAAKAIRGGKTIPSVPYMSEGQLPLNEINTVAGGRAQMTGDLTRPSNYRRVDGQEDILPQNENMGFGVTFADEERLVANGSQTGRANSERIADKIETLCGRIHPKQTCNVMLMMSQSALATLRSGLRPYGIESSEHSMVNMEISKDAQTGTVSIKYSSPEGLPIRFSWTASVDTEGNITTTPFVVRRSAS